MLNYKGLTGLTTMLYLLTPGAAISAENTAITNGANTNRETPTAEQETISAKIRDTVQSCGELLEQIKRTDCGGTVYSFFRGGYVSLGASAYTLGANLEQNEVLQAQFAGPDAWVPHYAIRTQRNFFGSSDFGYAYSFGFEQGAATKQTITRNGKDASEDFGTYVIGSQLSAEANLFYSFGGNDHTPHRYATFGVGLGLGYGRGKGKVYITENTADTHPQCDAAAIDLVNGDKSAISRIKQFCEYDSFNRAGLGISLRVIFDMRWENYFIGLESGLVGLAADGRLVSGEGDYTVVPIVAAVTFAYLIPI
jgi:hypothetical protein